MPNPNFIRDYSVPMVIGPDDQFPIQPAGPRTTDYVAPTMQEHWVAGMNGAYDGVNRNTGQGGGVWTFNNRAGLVILNSADIVSAGGALTGAFLPLTGGILMGQLAVQPATLSTSHFDAAQFITSTAQGSGVDGPQTAQIGLNINHQKLNYLTTSVAGELDGLYITVRQGGPGSDVGGLLVDVGNTGSGFSAILEGVSQQMAPTTGAIQRAIRAQIGGLNPQSNDYVGLYLEAQNAVSNTGILISDAPGQGNWTTFIEGWLSGSQNFVVYNNGGVFAAGGLLIGTGGQINVQGHLSATAPGAYLAFNRGGGDGVTYLLNNKGGGTSGGSPSER